VLGDPGIPTPNLSGEVPESAKTDLEKLQERVKELKKVVQEMGDYNKKIAAAKKAYDKALATLPQGDPGIEQAKQAYVSLFTNPEREALSKKFDELSGGARTRALAG
jgi:hypothetical protein